MTSGATLGELVSIDYNWGELSIFSRTEFAVDECCMAHKSLSSIEQMELEPDDIDLQDTVTFVWEINP